LVSDHLHRLQSVYDERFAGEYGPWRPVVAQVADSYPPAVYRADLTGKAAPRRTCALRDRGAPSIRPTRVRTVTVLLRGGQLRRIVGVALA
jgi:hypothetical protein